MLYKPTYCSNCGVKIDRIEWLPWTSRRFCEVCESEYKLYEWMMPIFAAGAILLGIFGVGSFYLTGEKPVYVAENQTSLKTAKPQIEQNAANKAENAQVAAKNNGNAAENAPAQKTPTEIVRRTDPPRAENVPVVTAKDPVYFCGAQTKKGTPCSRRVKGGGRCWQHVGTAAMLPPEKLLVSR